MPTEALISEATTLLSRVNAANVSYGLRDLLSGFEIQRFVDLVQNTEKLLRIANLNGLPSFRNFAQAESSAIDYSVISGLIRSLDCNVPIYIEGQPQASGEASGDSGGRDVGSSAEAIEKKMLAGAVVLALIVALTATGLAFWLKRRARRSKRHLICLRGNCVAAASSSTNGAPHPIFAIDISQAGIKLRHNYDELVKSDTPIEVVLQDFRFSGHVRWSDAQYLGVEFDRLLTKLELAAVLNKAEDSLDEFEADIQKAALAKLVPLSEMSA